MDVLSQHWMLRNLFTSTEPKDCNAVGEMESPFMWPTLNKALYCGAGEVAVLSKTKWTSHLGSNGKRLRLYSGQRGEKLC